jgi:hypothetical protein
METLITTLVGAVVAVIDAIVVPLANAIPLLASTGILLLVFTGLWVAFGAALIRDPRRLDAVWGRLRAMPLPVQAIAWLLLLPVLAGLWVWRTGWPRVARLAVIGGLAGWNLLVMVPRPA